MEASHTHTQVPAALRKQVTTVDLAADEILDDTHAI